MALAGCKMKSGGGSVDTTTERDGGDNGGGDGGDGGGEGGEGGGGGDSGAD
mgnify:CR=1 FL=1